jgi:ribonuclease P protein component
VSIPNAKAQVLLRLKERNQIQSLFQVKPFRTTGLFLFCDHDSRGRCAVSVTVSKKIFGKAVDRNRIKRMMREALKEIHRRRGVFPFSSAMILYSSSKIPLMGDLVVGMDRLISLAEKPTESKNRNKDIE